MSGPTASVQYAWDGPGAWALVAFTLHILVGWP